MTAVRREFRRQILPLAAGCVVSLAIASIWFIAAGEAYAKEFLLRQNLTRYTNAFDHAESVWYYFHKIFFNFLPWSVFLPFALVHGFRKRLWLPLVWFGFIFLFFEFSTSKRAVYLLPLYPAAALLVGVYIRERWASLLERTWSNWLIFVGGILITALPVALYVVGPMLRRYGPIIQETHLQIFGSMALLAAAGIAFLVSVRKKAFAPSLASLIFYVFVLGFTYAVVYVPAADRHFKSPHRIAGAALAIASNAEVYTYGFSSPGLIYYLGRPVKILRAPGDVAAQGDVMVITDQRQEDAKKTFPSLSVRKEVKYEKEVFTILTRGYEG
jgi:4-amino-4-deoxy-L-arabinose transferase-like glycosyltransferase